MTSSEKFQQALKERQRAKAEEEARKANGGNFNKFPEIPWTALFPNQEVVIRLRGEPNMEGRKPTDPRSMWSSMILGDDDKKFLCVVPNLKEHKDFILHRIFNTVMSYDWDGDAVGLDGRKGVRVYKHAQTHPAIFNRVSKNNNIQNPYESGWRFDEVILWNIIDRSAMDWHREQKKCRLLSKKASSYNKNGNEKTFFAPGVPPTVYNLILDDIVSMDGNTNWEDYDIVIKKLNDNPWYKVLHGIDDAKRITNNAKAKVVHGRLTEEELSWEMWDLDKLYPITSYKRIKEKLGLFIQTVDKAFGKTFYDELLRAVEKEEEEKAQKEAEQRSLVSATGGATTNTTPQKAVEPAQGVSQPKPTPILEQPVPQPTQTIEQPPIQPEPTAYDEPAKQEQPPVRQTRGAALEQKKVHPDSKMTPEKWQGLIDGTLTGKQYLGVPLMTEDEKSLVLDVNLETGHFIWDKARCGEIYVGSKSNFPSGSSCHVDPLDGTVFDESTVTPIPPLS